MTANQSGESVVVPREPTPEMLEPFARVLCSVLNIDPDEPEAPHGEWPNWYGECQPLANAYAAMLAAAPSPAAGSGEAVAWHKMAERRPEAGHKFVALFDDGSGAWLGFAHDAGVIDSDGDDYTKMPNAEWWAYLPSGFRLACEDHPTEDYNLPDHVCPPLFAAPPAPSADGGGLAWLIEAPGANYLAVRSLGRSEFYWTKDANKALRFFTKDDADQTAMAVRRMEPELWAFALTLGEAWPRQHKWLDAQTLRNGQADGGDA